MQNLCSPHVFMHFLNGSLAELFHVVHHFHHLPDSDCKTRGRDTRLTSASVPCILRLHDVVRTVNASYDQWHRGRCHPSIGAHHLEFPVTRACVSSSRVKQGLPGAGISNSLTHLGRVLFHLDVPGQPRAFRNALICRKDKTHPLVDRD